VWREKSFGNTRTALHFEIGLFCRFFSVRQRSLSRAFFCFHLACAFILFVHTSTAAHTSPLGESLRLGRKTRSPIQAHAAFPPFSPPHQCDFCRGALFWSTGRLFSRKFAFHACKGELEGPFFLFHSCGVRRSRKSGAAFLWHFVMHFAPNQPFDFFLE
jgi:hypothetical protein